MLTSADFDITRWTERKLNGVYVSKHGDDRNDGHPRRPVASLARAYSISVALYNEYPAGGYHDLVVSSGTYSDSAILNECRITGDGFVVFDGAGTTSFATMTGYENSLQLNRLTIQNYSILTESGNVSIGADSCILRNITRLTDNAFRNTNLIMRSTLAQNCFNVDTNHSGFVYLVENCTLLNTQLNWTGVGFNNPLSNSRIVRNTYLDASSSVIFKRGNPVGQVLYCNVEGQVGERDPNNGAPILTSLSAYAATHPGAIVNCNSTAPGFNNPDGGDYTLAATSPMRNGAFDGGFVGAYGVGINFSGLPDADSIVNAQWNSTLQAFILKDNGDRGLIEFVVKDFQRNWILKEALLVGQEDTIDRQTIDATLSYEVDGFGAPQNIQSGALQSGRVYWVAGYSAVNYNGQQYTDGQFIACTPNGGSNYTTIGEGKVVKLVEAPNIRLYEMKFSTVSAVDCVSRPWQYFVFNKVPTVDAAGRSNGDPLFNPATANPITVRWMKLRLTIMPNSLA